MPAPTYYATDILPYGVTLHRVFLTTADSLGTANEWGARLSQIAAHLPANVVKALLEGLDIWVKDMDSNTMDLEIAQGQANLQDFDLGTPGNQVGAGLYWNRDKLELAVFHDGWTPEADVSPYPIQAHNVLSAMDAMSHELGHNAAWFMELLNPSGAFVGKELTRVIVPELPGQASTPGEDLAENWRAVAGDDRARGFYSDRKPYRGSPKLTLALRVGPALYDRLRTKAFTDLKLEDAGFTWREWGYVTRFFLWMPWYPYPSWEVLGEYRLDGFGIFVKIK